VASAASRASAGRSPWQLSQPSTASWRAEGGGGGCCRVRLQQQLQGKVKAKGSLLRPAAARVRWRRWLQGQAASARSGQQRHSAEQGAGRCRDPSRCWWRLAHLVVCLSPGGLGQQLVPRASTWQLDLVGADAPGECKPTLVVFCFPFLFPFQPCIITYFPIFIRRSLTLHLTA
jgi:hypothetical protein